MNATDPTALDIRDVGVRLGGVAVVEAAGLSFRAGQFVALIGPNGAGKTSLLRAIAGLVPATGRIRIGGRDLGAMSLRDRAKAIAYLPQGHAVHWPLTARDAVALGRYPHGVDDPTRMRASDAAIVDDCMARTDTMPFAARAVQTLSGGERARVMLARVLAVKAGIVLADEPTAALDPLHQLGIMEALKTEASRGALVVAVTHDIGLAARLADRLILMDGGRIVAQGPPVDVLTDENLRRVYRVKAYLAEYEGKPVIVPWQAAT
jgi:iron complex transport system ATP-binding protein